MKRFLHLSFAVLMLTLLSTVNAAEKKQEALPANAAPAGSVSMQELKVRASWGHSSTGAVPFTIRLVPGKPSMVIRDAAGFSLESGEGLRDGFWQSRGGAGDVDGVEFTLVFPTQPASAPRQEHAIWKHLLQVSDADTVSRLRNDPAFVTDPLLLTVQMNAEATRGFSVSIDQLAKNRGLWVPELDVFLTAGDPPLTFAEHQKELQAWKGMRILDRIHREPEASYEQYTALWADMGNPKNNNPSHLVGMTWDSAIPKYGIDRVAAVTSDFGNPDQLRFSFDLDARDWKEQRLTDALPVINTVFERDGIRYEIEQFAYPLDGPPKERRGDIAMVLFQRVKATNLEAGERKAALRMTHGREFPEDREVNFTAVTEEDQLLIEEPGSHQTLMSVQGKGVKATFSEGPASKDAKRKVIQRSMDVTVPLELPARGSVEFIVKLPSPMASQDDRGKLLGLDYASARRTTLEFWSNYLGRGAGFQVPEKTVNDLFRANLWHALRLPRRHGGEQPGVQIDLPYSNFAYGQTGTPWPVNQAVYVDYMLYDLRGHHDLALEELLAIYHNNQQADGRVGGFANWGVYTPSMLYAVAKHCLLSTDRTGLETILPPTLRAMDWCLAEMKRGSGGEGPARGLILAPLNDLSHEPRAWAFNQAYMFAGLDLFGKLLRQLNHPRASECLAAAQSLRQAVARNFGNASMRSPLAQLRDHTWIPYVPCDALTPRRLFEQWYPTDIDTGALHLSRLKALDPAGLLTTCLLNDHEDNLFLNGWGMANEPVYNQQATVYLLRDDPEAAIRAFYSYIACAFSHSVLEPVEHRWGWGQYFGPPSTDGAWFELYRNMLIHEGDDDTLFIAQATPRAWLKDGNRIQIERAPSYYGPLSLTVDSQAATGKVTAVLEIDGAFRPETLLLRLRHPDSKPIKSVKIEGMNWPDFDAAKEWVRIKQPKERRYRFVVSY
ncbi:MAG: hypothetical protein ABI651_08570 [Verrucomicrobiota bacterium]